jgi:hypothetical protein
MYYLVRITYNNRFNPDGTKKVRIGRVYRPIREIEYHQLFEPQYFFHDRDESFITKLSIFSFKPDPENQRKFRAEVILKIENGKLHVPSAYDKDGKLFIN